MPPPFSSSTTLTKPITTTSMLTSSPSCTFFSILTLLLLTLISLLHSHHFSTTTTTEPKSLSQNALLHFHNSFLSSATNSTLSSYLHSLTLRPHLAGTPLSLSTALFVLHHFQSLDLSPHLTNYTTLLSYPTYSSLSAHFSNKSFTLFNLQEPSSSRNGVVRPYHAYSPSGSAYGKAVFLNHGREEDYRALAAQGVNPKGCVAIVRRGGGMSRNAVVEKAAEKGVAAVLMYTEGDGVTFKNGVERGTVMNGLGDPLSPGWASMEDGGERLGFEDNKVVKRFPRVPSMPVSEETAERILRTLEGGRVPYEWRATLKGKVGGLGPGPTVLNFTYQVGLDHFLAKSQLCTLFGIWWV